MQKGSLEPGKGMHILNKTIIPPYKGILMPHDVQCLGKAKECLPEARASG